MRAGRDRLWGADALVAAVRDGYLDRVMATYSIAEAKNALPRLIDRALAGEDVVITRRGTVVAEIRPRKTDPERAQRAKDALAALKELRESLPPVPLTSVELLDLMYEHDEE